MWLIKKGNYIAIGLVNLFNRRKLPIHVQIDIGLYQGGVMTSWGRPWQVQVLHCTRYALVAKLANATE